MLTSDVNRFAPGQPVWFRHGVSSRAPAVAGVFLRYGAVRCEVAIVDAQGRQRPRWVNATNLSVREPTA